MNPYDFYISPGEYEQAAKIGVDAENLTRRVRLLGWKKDKAIKKGFNTFEIVEVFDAE